MALQAIKCGFFPFYLFLIFIFSNIIITFNLLPHHLQKPVSESNRRDLQTNYI